MEKRASARPGGARAKRAGAANPRGTKADAQRNRAGRPTADELERRKLRVMQVATDMFVARGFAATTLLDIAKAAGVATRTLYQHFGDKEAIFHEVIFARDTAVLEPPRVKNTDDVETALHRAAKYSYEVALRSRAIDLMRLMIAESARFPELMSRVTNIIFSRFKANVAEVFRDLALRGMIPEGNHDESAELFVDLLLGNRTVMIYFGWMSARPTAADVAVKVDLFIRGRFGEQYLSTKAKSAKRIPDPTPPPPIAPPVLRVSAARKADAKGKTRS